MKEIELIGKRKAREKHFLKEKGVMVAKVYNEDIHFLKDGQYEEIDNSLIEQGNYIVNSNNAYKVSFAKISGDELMQMKTSKHFIKINLESSNKVNVKENITKSKLHKNICYSNILDNIDLEYNIMPAKVKEAIILQNKNAIFNNISFNIVTDLELKLNDNKTIAAMKNGKCIFEIEAPYMVDVEFKTNNNIYYELINISENEYKLKLVLDENWLKDENRKYPVMIDPTITNSGQDNSVYDTYIYEGDTGVDRNNQDILKVGVENIDGVNRINRTLIKFDLPTLGTGSQVISANLNLYGYPEEPYNYNSDLITVHQVTSSWNESTVTWDEIHDKYNSLVEGIIYATRGYYDYENETINPSVCGGDITRLVRKWYTGTPNHGIMLKHNEQKYNPNILPAFYSKNNNIEGGNPKPILAISYRNQNGILNYMDYQIQSFSNGTAYVNNYNGNLTTIFNVGQTIGGKMPVDLNLIYNTNDVILEKNVGFGAGYKLNLYQTIKEQPIEETTYLEYLDSDGTLHYFLNQKTTFDENGYNVTNTDNVYYDEDGLGMTITNNTNDYILKDKNGNIMKFVKNGDIAYLSEIEDISGNKNLITYNEEDKIIKIVDTNASEINISYGSNMITIVSPDETIVLNYSNNQLINMVNLLGTTYFEYNEDNILSKVTDINGLKIVYEYYEQRPYKVKKVSEYSINNNIGNYYNLVYGFDSTTIIDSKEKAKNIIFNSQGSIISISSLKTKDDIKNAYGISQINGTNDGTNPGYNNKLLRSEVPLKYVKNFLSNTSFEGNDIDFIGTNDVILSISNDFSQTGLNSLKAVSNSDNQVLTQNINVTKGEYYTFSAFVKNTSKVKLALGYIDENDIVIECEGDVINSNDEFERHDITINYPETATSDLYLKIYLDEIGTTYIDDIQLETGEVANNYNLLENSDFTNGFSDWTLSVTDPDTGEAVSTNDKFEIATLNDSTKSLKTKLNPAYIYNMEKTFNISGKGGDAFNLSFWYKNEGVDSNLSEYYGSRPFVSFLYTDQEYGHCGIPSPLLNPNDQSWQYISNDFIAEKDYQSITVSISHEYTANDFYITNMNLFKDIRNVYYEYDEYGNVILENDYNNENSIFKYDKNNQLVQTLDPNGERFVYEYDNIVADRVINGISDTGISNKIKYSNNNPVITKVTKNNVSNDLIDGLYKIRLKGKNQYLRNISNEIKIKDEDCNHDLWKIEKKDEYFKIHHSIITDKYFTINNNNLILTNEDGDNSLFIVDKNKNGSFAIKLKSEDKYLKYSDQGIEIDEFIEDDYHFEFYFETNDSNLFMESTAIYTDDNKYIKIITDTLLNSSVYTTDPTLGFIKTIENPNGQITNYLYNEKQQIISITNGEMKVKYNYNNNNCLDKIFHGRKVYNFLFNEFLKTQSVKVGEITLINNNYDSNNGEITSSNFGNNQQISYEYDEYGRLKSIIKADDIINYKYNSVGDIAKIISNYYRINHKYDSEKRLVNYEYNDFKINYTYDSNNNIICSKYKIDNNVIEKTNEYNNSLLTKIQFNDIHFNYTYDLLGRVEQNDICGGFNTKYSYLTNGNRTSSIVKSISNNDDCYSFEYDKMNNITRVYHNNILVHKYYYDNYNELIKEYDNMQKIITTYKYDNVGNILSKKIYDLNTFELIKKIKYEYQNNNWEDQLTKFDNIPISYDEIGNPLTIGDSITLTWKNGRELSTYKNGELNSEYKYNQDGLRIGKKVNGVETKYYLEGSNIIFEIQENDILYFMRDSSNNLIGFTHNDDKYYYVKNINEDIIGIIDNNYNMVATYEYDSWGNIISIKDGNSMEISSISNHIANINPFRYRSYYYDKETKLYYLKSRYYNPLWGRFISPDSKLNSNQDILSYNMYAYCSNNPVNNCDDDGKAICNLLKKAISKLVKKTVKTVSKISKAVSEYWQKSLNKSRADSKNKKKNTSSKYLNCQIKKTNPKTSNLPDYTVQLDRILESNVKSMEDKGIGEAQIYFYKMVKDDKGPWDYKEEEVWKKNLDIPFPSNLSKFIWRGYVIDVADFGNINYGYVGKAIRFPDTILYMGGGYQESGGFTAEVFKGPYYGDKPEDICAVKIGIEEYNK